MGSPVATAMCKCLVLKELNFYGLLVLFSHFSVFSMLGIMYNLFHFLSFQSCRSLRNISLGSHILFLGLIKSSYHGWLSAMTSSDLNFLALPRAPQSWSTTQRERKYWREHQLRMIFFDSGHLQSKHERPEMERTYMDTDKVQRKEPE